MVEEEKEGRSIIDLLTDKINEQTKRIDNIIERIPILERDVKHIKKELFIQ